jgi:hypothetical protein
VTRLVVASAMDLAGALEHPQQNQLPERPLDDAVKATASYDSSGGYGPSDARPSDRHREKAINLCAWRKGISSSLKYEGGREQPEKILVLQGGEDVKVEGSTQSWRARGWVEFSLRGHSGFCLIGRPISAARHRHSDR